ncbi:MAG TPA: dTMP kinase [Dissulfurispiraceae bacterium]|nr:dTMP kinase [Dissulfurispiraceae bacterium]
MEQKKGVFLSFEGIEGTGKTTQARLLSERLQAEGHDVVLTFEPGGTVIGSRIREILLLPEHLEMSAITELLLYNAARAQHLAEKILPAIKKGKIIITDRFSDSTVAYQCYARGIDKTLVMSLDQLATGGLLPDLTLLFDLDAEAGLARNRNANKTDRIELEDIEFHRRVREGYLAVAKADPDRVSIVDAALPIAEVRAQVWKIVKERLKAKG